MILKHIEELKISLAEKEKELEEGKNKRKELEEAITSQKKQMDLKDKDIKKFLPEGEDDADTVIPRHVRAKKKSATSFW